jgi:hypothetical protein
MKEQVKGTAIMNLTIITRKCEGAISETEEVTMWMELR